MANLNQQMYELIDKMFDATRRQRVVFRQRPQREAVLKYLAKFPEGVNPSQIAEQLGLARPAVTSMIASMEESGYLTRTMNQTDKRRMDVRITAEGIKQKEDLIALNKSRAKELVEYLGEEDCKELLRLMERIEQFMNKA